MFGVISTLSNTFWVAISFALLERRDNAQFNVVHVESDKAVDNTPGTTNYSQFLTRTINFFLSQARL